MIDFDFKDKNQIYQLIAGISGVTVILIGALVVMAPFFPAFLLATILTLATWPAFAWLSRKLHSRTALAAFLMTCLLAACFIFPLVIIGTGIAENFTKVYSAVQGTLQNKTEDTAKLLQDIPYVGLHLEKYWTLVANDKERLSAALQEYAAPTSQKLIHMGGAVGRGLLDITLGVLISYFFFRYGTRVAVRLGNLIEKFGGERGQHILDVSKNTLIGVVYGIIGTGVAQGALAAFGFWIADVPGATFLGLMTFFLSFIPMGPPLLWIPAALWLYTEGNTTWGIFLIIWGVLVISSVDNFLKPYFISLGSDLPLLLVLLGILGGVMAFGFIGVFIGPTILAVAYSLMIEWSSTREQKA
ncbi:MAG: AI-2E family transporter [Alphaproteobacteria bacterium]|nr:AI-2E family transporter [Alphaproteobacteria bacterium]